MDREQDRMIERARTALALITATSERMLSDRMTAEEYVAIEAGLLDGVSREELRRLLGTMAGQAVVMATKQAEATGRTVPDVLADLGRSLSVVWLDEDDDR